MEQFEFIKIDRMRRDMAFIHRIGGWMAGKRFFNGTKVGTFLGLLILKHLVNLLSKRWVNK